MQHQQNGPREPVSQIGRVWKNRRRFVSGIARGGWGQRATIEHCRACASSRIVSCSGRDSRVRCIWAARWTNASRSWRMAHGEDVGEVAHNQVVHIAPPPPPRSAMMHA